MRLRTASFRLVSLVSLVALAHGAFAACGDNPGDANAVAAARQAADSQCNCSTAKTHRTYRRCVRVLAGPRRQVYRHEAQGGRQEGGRLLSCQAKVAATDATSGLMVCESSAKTTFSTAFGKAGSCVGDHDEPPPSLKIGLPTLGVCQLTNSRGTGGIIS